MTCQDTQAFATIDDHFATYAKTTTEQTVMEGFVSWVWDMRQDALDQLKAGDTSLDADIVYSISQIAQLDGEIEVPSEQECAAWLMANRDDLIKEITESLELWL